MSRPVICMRGAEAARIPYNDRFQRQGAMPAVVRKTLFGQDGMQGLDGEAHHHRKQVFMSLMTPAAIDHLAEQFEDLWRAAITGWVERGEVVLYGWGGGRQGEPRWRSAAARAPASNSSSDGSAPTMWSAST